MKRWEPLTWKIRWSLILLRSLPWIKMPQVLWTVKNLHTPALEQVARRPTCKERTHQREIYSSPLFSHPKRSSSAKSFGFVGSRLERSQAHSTSLICLFCIKWRWVYWPKEASNFHRSRSSSTPSSQDRKLRRRVIPRSVNWINWRTDLFSQILERLNKDWAILKSFRYSKS